MFGHPLHPAVVHFPLALLLSATVADLVRLAGLTTDTHIAAILMAGGLAMGVVAMGAGLFDFAKLETGIVPHALRHMTVMGIAWLGYAVALYSRRDILAGGTTLSSLSLALSVISALALSVGGFLGGRLVYTFGAAVAKPAERPKG
jgi:uncharacterized membrane protein